MTMTGSNVTGRVFEFNTSNVNFDFATDADNVTAQGWTAVYVTKRSALCGSQLFMADKGFDNVNCFLTVRNN